MAAWPIHPRTAWCGRGVSRRRAPVLDEAQRRVVEHGGGPLLVLAGPGTGKTTTLVEAAVARVEAGVPVDDILMLTFSRRAAGELRDRVTARLGPHGPRTCRPHVALVRVRRAAHGQRGAGSARATPAVRAGTGHPDPAAARRAWPSGGPSTSRPALRTRAFAGELRDLLMRAVERGLDGPTLTELGRRRGRADWVAAGDFLTEYQSVTALREARRLRPRRADQLGANAFDDDPRCSPRNGRAGGGSSSTSTRTPIPPRPSCSRCSPPGADELILVGDPDQSIYAFRGADDSAIRAGRRAVRRRPCRWWR